MKNKTLLLGFFIFWVSSVFSTISAAKIDTIQVYSESMKKNVPVLVAVPDNYTSSKKYPAVYMLHGYSGSYIDSWFEEDVDARHWADLCEMILVVPDGGFSSWYFDSPIDPTYRYETFVSKELVSYIDEHFSTMASPKGRAITGLSMGGHGAFYLSFRHQDIFGAAGSTSGGLDIRPFPLNWDMAKRLGSYSEYPENWEKNTVINLVHLLIPNSLALIFDCGTEDFFYEANQKLHEKLLYMNIPHEFISRPGKHNGEYWKNSIDSHMMFFHKFFIKNK
ncbi:MAG: alpha/beta hydrolase family protein [Dysgonomonas sp.]|nr:alpha/beta hydrolase family protein [Dysgonomonas sp.]